jgi:hypothetical protein
MKPIQVELRFCERHLQCFRKVLLSAALERAMRLWNVSLSALILIAGRITTEVRVCGLTGMPQTSFTSLKIVPRFERSLFTYAQGFHLRAKTTAGPGKN